MAHWVIARRLRGGCTAVDCNNFGYGCTAVLRGCPLPRFKIFIAVQMSVYVLCMAAVATVMPAPPVQFNH